jgi:FdhD protein
MRPMSTKAPKGSVAETRVRRLQTGADDVAARADSVAVEAPLEVRMGGKSATVLMRTPGHDEELVRGFLYDEGIVSSLDEILGMTRPDDLGDGEDGNVIAVELAKKPARKLPDRAFYSSSSCGVCGKKSIASLEIRAAPVNSALTVSRGVLSTLPAKMRSAQSAFDATGGLHASALFTAKGDLVVLREDVGRHNALDKVVGWALAAGRLPLSDCVLLVSGRVSYEIVQKAIVAGLPVLAAVGAPSSLAVDLSEEFGVTLAGFVRPDSMNVYTHGGRVTQ